MRRSATDGPAHPLLTISRSLQILAVVLLALIVGVTAQQLFRMRDGRITDTERQMMRLNMVFAEQTGRAVETIDLIMQSLTETLETARADPPVEPTMFNDLIRRRIDGVRQARDIVIVDNDGAIEFASRPNIDPAFRDAAIAVARAAAVMPGTQLRISEPIRGTDGSWTALMSRRIENRSGAFDGVVVALMNLQYFEDFYKAVELAENGAIVLHRRDGTVLARYPHSETIIGKSFAELPPFKEVLAHAMAGTTIMDSPVDGSRRVLAIRALKAFPLAVNISVEERMVLETWHRQVLLFAGGALVASAIVGGLLLLLARRSREIETLVAETRGARDLAEQTSQRLREQMEEREQAEAALRQAQRIEAVGRLTGGVAHDFNNLLTVILGNIDLLLNGGGLTEATSERLMTIRGAADRGATLTSQLLAFARRQPLVPQAVDLNAVICGMQDLLRSALRSTIRVDLALSPDLWPAMVDPTQVELVVLNLAINARDAMPEGGRLAITTANIRLGPPQRPEEPPGGDYVDIAVADEGHGMTGEVLARAFEPFFTTKATGSGSGLGLSQVFGLAQQSGGGVRIDSTPRAGTTVHVYLPRAAAMAARPAVPPPSSFVGGTARVLLVDDDDAVRDTTAVTLERLGYVVIQADGAAAALRILDAASDVHLLLTDVAMPGVSGPELARQAMRLRPGLPVVFISGFADPEQLAGEAGMQRLVRKPFRAAALAAQIERALAEASVAGG